MHSLGKNISYIDGDSVRFYTLPYTTRMVVIRLADGSLWLHSPIQFTSDLAKQIDALGEVRYLVAPNKLHHLFLKDWQQHYPSALIYGTEQVCQKRPDIHFNGVLSADWVPPWRDDISQLLFTGSKVMQECVFFHRSSRTLIVTDLIENFPAHSFTPFKRLLAKLAGVLAPNGKMPIDWRLTFKKLIARQHLQQIIDWQPEKIVMAHGEVIEERAVTFLKSSFSWLNLSSSTKSS